MENLKNSLNKKYIFLFIFSLLAFFLNGLYYGFEKAVLLILILGFFAFKILKGKYIYFPKGIMMNALIGMFLANILGLFYYVEKGMSIYLVLFTAMLIVSYIFIYNLEDEDKIFIKSLLAAFSVVLVLFIIIFSKNEFIHYWGYIVNGDMAGPFEYSNSFSLFLLISLHIILNEEEAYSFIKPKYKKPLTYTGYLILLLGISFTHSIIGIILTLFYLVYFLLKQVKVNRHRIIILSSLFLFALVIFIISGEDFNSLVYSARFSSIKTRFIYYRDALAMIKNYPLGYGYMGYYFAQRTFQSSYPYNVRFVHSMPIQVLLDFGDLGFLLMLGFFISLFNNLRKKDRFIFFIMILHSFLDFHFQYFIFFIILFLFIDFKFKENVIKNTKKFGIILVSLSVFSLYVFAFDLAAYKSGYDLARKLYPYHTFSYIKEHDRLDENTRKELVNSNEYLYIIDKDLAEYYLRQGMINDYLNYLDLYLEHNELGDFADYFYITSLLELAENGSEDERIFDRILAYPAYVEDLRRRKATNINVKHEMNFDLDEDIKDRISRIKK